MWSVDNAQGNIGPCRARRSACRRFRKPLFVMLRTVSTSNLADALNHAREALEAHAGIRVLLLQARCSCRCRRCRTERIRCSLPIWRNTVAAKPCSPACGSRNLAAVIVDLRTRTARTEPHAPRRSSLAEAEEMRSGARCRSPRSDFERLVVVHVDRRIWSGSMPTPRGWSGNSQLSEWPHA